MAPRMAIIGAGPGGCMLARLLYTSKPSIAVSIFEAEVSVNYRSQGGTLDLRTETGLAAIKEANLWDEFQKYARYDGESLLITDKNLVTWLRRKPRKDGNDKRRQLQEAPEIDRADLRKMLMESLPPDSIRWGYKLSKIEERSSGLSLHFANGAVLSGYDLIVGCDGAFSRTRSLVSREKPFYSGIAGWAMRIPAAAHTAPEVYKLVNRGSVFAYSDHRSLSIQQLADDSVQVSSYAAYPEDYKKTCGFDVADPGAAKRALIEALSGWTAELLDAVEKTQGEVMWRDLYMLPVGFTWSHKAGITLLGDAAHLMTPFAGIGVNTAFWDAVLLSREISEYCAAGDRAHGSLDEHVRRYEEKMFVGAHKAQQLTEGSMNDMLFKPGAPRTSIEFWILRHVKEHVPGWSHPLVTALVYSGYWVYKRIV